MNCVSRSALETFVAAMEEELKNNDGRGGWRTVSTHCLAAQLRRNLFNLENSLEDKDTEYSKRTCADVANYAMMIFDILSAEH